MNKLEEINKQMDELIDFAKNKSIEELKQQALAKQNEWMPYCFHCQLMLNNINELLLESNKQLVIFRRKLDVFKKDVYNKPSPFIEPMNIALYLRSVVESMLDIFVYVNQNKLKNTNISSTWRVEPIIKELDKQEIDWCIRGETDHIAKGCYSSLQLSYFKYWKEKKFIDDYSYLSDQIHHSHCLSNKSRILLSETMEDFYANFTKILENEFSELARIYNTFYSTIKDHAILLEKDECIVFVKNFIVQGCGPTDLDVVKLFKV